MLYKKNSEKALSDALFKNPTSEYRGAPFWSWNCKLSEQELLWQIDVLKRMGFGGFHMHPRSGFATVYLSDEHMQLVRACTEKAKDEGMLAWLYDEDRWASGFAGGYVTKDRRNSAKYLLFTANPIDGTLPKNDAIPVGAPYFFAAYDITQNPDGSLDTYAKIGENDAASGRKLYVYVCTEQPSGWRNGQTYVDVLSPRSADDFLKITHETYKKSVGDYFGKQIPAIFTDEPNFYRKNTLDFAQQEKDITLPWTTDFDEYYREKCGLDLAAHLPELLFELPGGKPSVIRWRYHDLICELFAEAFIDRCGKWCEENGIYLTGHLLAEQTLDSQTIAVGETMRLYRGFGLPGIDMLCDNIELSTAKQAQSVSRQRGQEGVLSELYGVTGWDFDFRGHKFQGDWQAALGVTVRVPHLSWVSMKGSAKRDYPASISYQSPWYEKYSYIENHFARLNTALTRGKPVVNVGVIHPIESYWLSFGPSDVTESTRTQLEERFDNVIKWLLFGTIDFDFISEALLPSQCGEISDTLAVGEMNYSAIVVPGCLTLRRSTLDILAKFREKGGKVIFLGSCPKYADAESCEEICALYDACEHIDFDRVELLARLADERAIEIRNSDGSAANNLIYQLRRDGDGLWLFIAHAKKNAVCDNARPQDTLIKIRGSYKPVIYNTIDGEKEEPAFGQKDGCTLLRHTFFSHDSLLLRLESGECCAADEKPAPLAVRELNIKENVGFELAEPNVYLLDMAEYSTDGGKTFCETEEILRIDKKIREIYDYPLADGCDIQPWAIKPEKIEHFPILKFTVDSEIETSCRLAYEYAEEITLNGETVEITPDGFFVDHSISTLALPPLRAGKNELLIKVPIGKRISIENFFLLGNFGVRVRGCEKTITSLPEKLGFGDITSQGLPFYGGNVVYKTIVNLPECRLRVRTNYYRGAAVEVFVDGKSAGLIAFDPYMLDLGELADGKHEISFVLYGNRYNTFGALHNNDKNLRWLGGPLTWYSTGDCWSYDYQLHPTGILSAPIFEYCEL